MQASNQVGRFLSAIAICLTATLTLLACLAVAMTGLFVRALLTSEWTGALFLVGFAFLFVWQVGGFIRRNRPRRYRFDDLPDALLPLALAVYHNSRTSLFHL